MLERRISHRPGGETVLQQFIHGDRMRTVQVGRALQRSVQQFFIRLLQERVVQAHAQTQFTEYLCVRFRLAHGSDGRTVQHHVGVADVRHAHGVEIVG